MALDWTWPALLITWALLGIGYSAVQTPTGRLLRRSAQPDDRPALFAAQFALSHAAWLVTYPLAGWLGAAAGIPFTLLVLGGLTLVGLALAAWLWPAHDPDIIAHDHPNLAPDHPHLREGTGHGRRRGDKPVHVHPFVIDDLHRGWPPQAARPGA
jgi:MFS family permease